MNKSELKAIFINAKATGAKYIGVSIQTEGSSQPEIIINPNANFDAKFDYYMEAYDDDLILIAAKGKKDIRITAAGQGNSFEDIECQLIGERGKGWRELIAAAIDKAYENMIANTPPTTEEEKTHCEMIKEAVKGMFINESRTAAEAEFIKTHIVDYGGCAAADNGKHENGAYQSCCRKGTAPCRVQSRKNRSTGIRNCQTECGCAADRSKGTGTTAAA